MDATDYVSDDEDSIKEQTEEDLKQKMGNFNLKSHLKFDKSRFIFKSEGIIKNHYSFMKEVGSGGYGKVYRVKNRDTQQIRAIKAILRSKIKRWDRFKNEVEAMKCLDHPNVIKLFEIFEDDKRVYLVQEICSGGELFDRIVEEGTFNEQQGARIFKQMLGAVKYMHINKICHRDLKPENFLFETADINSDIKLIDFGLSSFFTDGESFSKVKMSTCCGTSYYMAPEVIVGEYTETCDLWSLGVIMYIMLSGVPPFYSENDEEIYEMILKGHVKFTDTAWASISDEAKDLILKLLVSAEKRISINDAIKHPWLSSENTQQIEQINSKLLRRLSTFRKSKKLKKAFLMYIVANLPSHNLVEERKEFVKIDQNNDGYISVNELEIALKGLKDSHQIKKMLSCMDADKNELINYSATITKDLYLMSEKLQEAFKAFDKDQNGFISIEELIDVIGGSESIEVDAGIMEKVLSEADTDGDGKINFQEFVNLMNE